MRKTLIIGIIVMLVTIPALTACTGATTESRPIPLSILPSLVPSSNLIAPNSSETITPEAQEIMTKTISAMNQITSFKLDSDIIDTIGYSTSTDEWKGTKSINISDKEMQITMTVDTEVSTREIEKDSTAFDMYFFNGWEYFDITLPESYSGWSKTHQYDDWWEPELQIPNLIELLNTAKAANSAGNEILDGIDCFVLNITPTATSTSDWIYSQYQPVGPSKVSAGGGEISYNDKNSQGISLKVWISKEKYLVLKVEVNALFSGITAPIGTSIQPETSNEGVEFIDKIYGQMDFLEYNQPAIIQPPTEALNAK